MEEKEKLARCQLKPDSVRGYRHPPWTVVGAEGAVGPPGTGRRPCPPAGHRRALRPPHCAPAAWLLPFNSAPMSDRRVPSTGRVQSQQMALSCPSKNHCLLGKRKILFLSDERTQEAETAFDSTDPGLASQERAARPPGDVGRCLGAPLPALPGGAPAVRHPADAGQPASTCREVSGLHRPQCQGLETWTRPSTGQPGCCTRRPSKSRLWGAMPQGSAHHTAWTGRRGARSPCPQQRRGRPAVRTGRHTVRTQWGCLAPSPALPSPASIPCKGASAGNSASRASAGEPVFLQPPVRRPAFRSQR